MIGRIATCLAVRCAVPCVSGLEIILKKPKKISDLQLQQGTAAGRHNAVSQAHSIIGAHPPRNSLVDAVY